jgi:RNA polymerase sigma-70 factor (ECF subfamily)
MNRKENISRDYESLLLQQFNNRESQGFGEVYLFFHDDLHCFANKFFQGTDIAPDDVIQDIFIHIWEKRNTVFDSLKGIKSYLYVSIRNQYLKHIEHLKRVDEYQQMLLSEDRLVALVAENEIFSYLSASADLLSEECAKVFKLCLEGWEIKEIADKLGKSESTVYKQKNEAIVVLRKKLPKDKLFFIMLLIH